MFIRYARTGHGLRRALFCALDHFWLEGGRFFVRRLAFMAIARAGATAAGAAAGTLVLFFIPDHLEDDREKYRRNHEANHEGDPVIR